MAPPSLKLASGLSGPPFHPGTYLSFTPKRLAAKAAAAAAAAAA
jgi:hypothetical protein